MTERLAEIVVQIQNVRQLESVVTAMRGIAASRAQKGRSLLSGIDSYSQVISHAIGQALSLLPGDIAAAPPSPHARPTLILFCAEQGFAGAFSERVLDAVTPEAHGATNLIIGTRGSIIANERGLKTAWSAPMATHVDAIPGFANRLAEALYRYVADGAVTKVDIVYSRTSSGGGLHVDRHSLLPIDFSRFAKPVQTQPPLMTLVPELLVRRFAAEYVYAQLCEAAMHAFAAENDARMMAMASAKTNIGTKLAALSQREQQIRQQEITTEIVELAAGAEAARRGRA